jgi:hypothetical protein
LRTHPAATATAVIAEWFLALSMDPWGRSSFTDKIASRLVEDGLLRPVTNVTQPEWIIPAIKMSQTPCRLHCYFVHFVIDHKT